MKVNIEFQNDEVATESAVNSAEITSPQVTTAEQLAKVVHRIIASTPLRSPAVMAALVENHLRPEDVPFFLSCLSDDTLTMLTDHFSDSEFDENRVSYPVQDRGEMCEQHATVGDGSLT